MNKITPKLSPQKKNFYTGVLAFLVIVAILLCISITREFFLGVFGYAIFAYVPAGILLYSLLLAGKKPTIKKSRAVVYVLLFFMAVATLHVAFAKSIINSDANYVFSPYETHTVGGVFMGAVTYVAIAISRDYGFVTVTFFIITAILGFIALYPLILRIGQNKKPKELVENKAPQTNPIARDLNVYTSETEALELIENTVKIGAEDVLFKGMPTEGKERRDLFVELDSDEDRVRARTDASADILFENKEIPDYTQKTPRRYSALEKLSGNYDIDKFYTNQGRSQALEDGLRARNDYSEYEERYGSMPTYGITSPNGSYPFEKTTPKMANPQAQFMGGGYYDAPVTNVQKAVEEPKTTTIYDKPIEKPIVKEEKPYGLFDKRFETEEVKKETVPEEKPYGLFDKRFEIEEKIEEKPAVDEKLTKDDARNYFQTPITPDEYGKYNFGFEEEVEEVVEVEEVDYEPEVEAEPVYEKPRIPELVQEKPKATPKPTYKSDVMKKEKIELPSQSKPIQQNLFSTENEVKYVKPKPYKAPPLDLLKDYGGSTGDFPADYEIFKANIERTLQEFEVPATVVTARRGPSFTLYELQLGPGYPISKIRNLKENLKMRLCVKNLRILAPIEGKDALGIEVPNDRRDTVGLRSIINSAEFNEKKGGAVIGFGKTLEGKAYVADLAKMPHLLVAGATGTGKSVFLNSLIVSLLYRYSPEDLRMILIDPKKVELTMYKELPNLLIKDPVKESKHAVNVLKWLTQEMDRRYDFFEKVGCANIDQYNNDVRDQNREPKMPRIVLIIDEMADLMMKAKGEVEDYVVRIAQLARACGIHMVIATQRPTAQVITGLIKANILARVAFTVKSGLDSRVILDDMGAEDLLGNGDMLFSHTSTTTRIQGAFIDNPEIRSICQYIKNHNEGTFDENIAKEITAEPEQQRELTAEERQEARQEIKDAETEVVLRKIMKGFLLKNKASVSSVQTDHGIGYIRAKKLVDELTRRGYLGPEDGSKPREIKITMEEFFEIFGED